MTVQELIEKLQAVDPNAEVEVCFGADYYDIDPEFSATVPPDSGKNLFVIEVDDSCPR